MSPLGTATAVMNAAALLLIAVNVSVIIVRRLGGRS